MNRSRGYINLTIQIFGFYSSDEFPLIDLKNELANGCASSNAHAVYSQQIEIHVHTHSNQCADAIFENNILYR